MTIKEKELTNVLNIVELNYITSMLDEEEIPYRIMDKGVGSYLHILHGINYSGTTIYVREEDFDKANLILQSYDSNDYIEEIDTSDMHSDEIQEIQEIPYDDKVEVESQSNRIELKNFRMSFVARQIAKFLVFTFVCILIVTLIFTMKAIFFS